MPGEPAGIGPDLCISLAATEWAERIAVVADIDVLNPAQHSSAASLFVVNTCRANPVNVAS